MSMQPSQQFVTNNINCNIQASQGNVPDIEDLFCQKISHQSQNVNVVKSNQSEMGPPDSVDINDKKSWKKRILKRNDK